MRSEQDRETDIHIMKTALVCLIEAVESGDRMRMNGLRRGIKIDRIRDVYQNLPEVDGSYLEAKRIIEGAARVIKEEKIPYV
jgi:hypothetical protein